MRGSGQEPTKLVVAEVLIEELVALVEPKIREAKAGKLSLAYRRSALTPIMVAEREFHGVLENLVENALEAISVGGNIKIEIENGAGVCRVRVEDDGCGIAKDRLDRLFTQGGSFGRQTARVSAYSMPDEPLNLGAVQSLVNRLNAAACFDIQFCRSCKPVWCSPVFSNT